MADAPKEDRLIVTLDPGGPIELLALTESFAGLAHMYDRHYRRQNEQAPKLFVTRLEDGSVIAEIAPYAVILGGLVATMGGVNTVAEFTRRLISGIRSFADIPNADDQPKLEVPSTDDARDIREFLKPLAGRRDARLDIKHARLEKRVGRRRTIVEVTFDEVQINRAAINIDAKLGEADGGLLEKRLEPRNRAQPISEAMLFFEAASQSPGKAKGRTADRGVVPSVSAKAAPIYFLKCLQHLKDQMVKGEVNPFTSAFVVDGMVQYVGDEPRGYIITDVREIIPLDEL